MEGKQNMICRKFAFDNCGFMINSHVTTNGLLLVQQLFHMCGHTHLQSYMSPGMACVGPDFRVFNLLNNFYSGCVVIDH